MAIPTIATPPTTPPTIAPTLLLLLLVPLELSSPGDPPVEVVEMVVLGTLREKRSASSGYAIA